MDGYLNIYKETVEPEMMGKQGIKYVITEAGAQNWTDDMIVEFAKRRGYDPHPWLPVLTGHIVESAQASDHFLQYFCRAIDDLTADEHYGQWFNRNETWAEDARSWIDYLSFSSYILQQGQAVADVLYFYGEDFNITALFASSAPEHSRWLQLRQRKCRRVDS